MSSLNWLLPHKGSENIQNGLLLRTFVDKSYYETIGNNKTADNPNSVNSILLEEYELLRRDTKNKDGKVIRSDSIIIDNELSCLEIKNHDGRF